MKRQKIKQPPLLIKPSNKYKMDPEEVQLFLHMKRKGSNVTPDKTKFSRKIKHKNKN